MTEMSRTQWAGAEIKRLAIGPVNPEAGQLDPVNPEAGQPGPVHSMLRSIPLVEWQQELDSVAEKGGKLEQLEVEIVRRLQRIFISLPYEKGHGTPEQMILSGKKNCEGATILGSIVLEKLGIGHRIISSESPTNSPGHVLLLLLGSGGSVYWCEMTRLDPPEVIEASAFSEFKDIQDPRDLYSTLSDKGWHRLSLVDSKFKGKAGSDMWGFAPNLSIKTSIYEPNEGRVGIVLRRQASNLFKIGDITGAVSCLEELNHLGLAGPDELNNLAHYQSKSGDVKGAAKTLETLCGRWPDRLTNRIDLAKNIEELGDLAAAERYFRELFKDRPVYLVLREFCRFLIKQKRYQESKDLLLQFISDSPDFLPAYLDLAEFQIKFEPDQAQNTLNLVETNFRTISKYDRVKILQLQESLNQLQH